MDRPHGRCHDLARVCPSLSRLHRSRVEAAQPLERLTNMDEKIRELTDQVQKLLKENEDLRGGVDERVCDLVDENKDLKRQLEKARIERDLLMRIVKGA